MVKYREKQWVLFTYTSPPPLVRGAGLEVAVLFGIVSNGKNALDLTMYTSGTRLLVSFLQSLIRTVQEIVVEYI